MIRRPPISTLFPYTNALPIFEGAAASSSISYGLTSLLTVAVFHRVSGVGFIETLVLRRRSEEHTSELQSLTNLVCRLLLEKKKKEIYTHVQLTHNIIIHFIIA